ncbi:MAG TPA: hypothetical protein VFU35_07230 [Jatrophihabitans sp.]|nr:hypothetical protein [Jatrophihabitans sp.]
MVRAGELGRVALVELGGFVELRMALAGRVATQPDDPFAPVAGPGRVVDQPAFDMRRMRAVDQEVIRRRGRVDRRDRLRQRDAAGQPAVGFHRERDRGGHAGVARGSHDADRLANVGERIGGDEVRAGRRE